MSEVEELRAERDALRRNEEQIRAAHGWKRDGRELPVCVAERLAALGLALTRIYGMALLIQQHGCRPERIQAILDAVEDVTPRRLGTGAGPGVSGHGTYHR